MDRTKYFELVNREKSLEDIRASLMQERRYAFDEKDWPRLSEVKQRIAEVDRRLRRIAARLAAHG